MVNTYTETTGAKSLTCGSEQVGYYDETGNSINFQKVIEILIDFEKRISNLE